MSLHKLSAGGGATHPLRHTCCGDVERAANTPLSAYYTAKPSALLDRQLTPVLFESFHLQTAHAA